MPGCLAGLETSHSKMVQVVVADEDELGLWVEVIFSLLPTRRDMQSLREECSFHIRPHKVPLENSP